MLGAEPDAANLAAVHALLSQASENFSLRFLRETIFTGLGLKVVVEPGALEDCPKSEEQKGKDHHGVDDNDGAALGAPPHQGGMSAVVATLGTCDKEEVVLQRAGAAVDVSLRPEGRAVVGQAAGASAPESASALRWLEALLLSSSGRGSSPAEETED